MSAVVRRSRNGFLPQPRSSPRPGESHAGALAGSRAGLGAELDVSGHVPRKRGHHPRSYARCDRAHDMIGDSGRGSVRGTRCRSQWTDPRARRGQHGWPSGKSGLPLRESDRPVREPVAGKSGLRSSPRTTRRGRATQTPVSSATRTSRDSLRRVGAPTGATTPTARTASANGRLLRRPDGHIGIPAGRLAPERKRRGELGIFAPGDVIHYFLGAKNSAGAWTYVSQGFDGQGASFVTNDVSDCVASPMEWSVLPDAGRTRVTRATYSSWMTPTTACRGSMPGASHSLTTSSRETYSRSLYGSYGPGRPIRRAGFVVGRGE